MAREGVIIVAAGYGTRMGTDIPKQFMEIAGKPMLIRTVECFTDCMPQAAVTAVVPAAFLEYWERMAERYLPHGVITTVTGGPNRTESVRRGLSAMEGCDIIAVHDGARPLASADLIRNCFATAAAHGTAIPAVEPADSFRIYRHARAEPVDRRALRAVQTPQVFRGEILRDAYARAEGQFSDDATLVENAGYALTLCNGQTDNIKITFPSDLAYAEAVIRAREQNRNAHGPI